MPRITFEYTDNLAIRDEIDAFIKDVHEDLVSIIQTDLFTCRTVIQRHEDYLIGDGDVKNAFIQLSIKMLPGRSNLIKNKLGTLLLDKINHQFSGKIQKLNTQVRVYLTEVDIAHYYGLPDVVKTRIGAQ